MSTVAHVGDNMKIQIRGCDSWLIIGQFLIQYVENLASNNRNHGYVEFRMDLFVQ